MGLEEGGESNGGGRAQRGLRLGYAWLLPWKLQPGILLCCAQLSLSLSLLSGLSSFFPPSFRKGIGERSDKNKENKREGACSGQLPTENKPRVGVRDRS